MAVKKRRDFELFSRGAGANFNYRVSPAAALSSIPWVRSSLVETHHVLVPNRCIHIYNFPYLSRKLERKWVKRFIVSAIPAGYAVKYIHKRLWIEYVLDSKIFNAHILRISNIKLYG